LAGSAFPGKGAQDDRSVQCRETTRGERPSVSRSRLPSGAFPVSPSYYPMFVSLEGRVCLVVGGGTVAERKIRGLLPSGAAIRVVARTLTSGLWEWVRDGRVQYLGETYREDLLEEADLVFAATSDAGLNEQVARQAGERRLWCNTATGPEMGSFIVPSLIERGPLAIAVSTTGLSPAVARQIREKLEGEFGPEWASFLEWMGRLRKLILSKSLGSDEKQRLFRKVSNLPLPAWIREGRREEAFHAVLEVCNGWIHREELSRIWDELWKPSS